MDYAAQLSGVTKVFEKKQVLRDISFSVEKREIVAVLGPSGCGKSTLLRILAGIENVTQGSVLLPTESRVGFVFQESLLLPWLTARENVVWVNRSASNSKKMRGGFNLETLAQKLGLTSSLNKFPHQLSGGLKMRVALLRALIFDPSLLLLDEPFSALDEILRIEAQKLLFDLWKETQFSAVLVTHSTTEALLLSQRILIMNDQGELSAQVQNVHENFTFPLSRTQTQLSHEIYSLLAKTRQSLPCVESSDFEAVEK